MESEMPERRRYPRIRIQKDAKIVIGTFSVLDCVVRDLSSTGARIEIPDAAGLPEAVDVTFDGGRTFRPCRLRWRSPNETGVEFFEAAA
jgi:hypothetical protein